MKKFLSLVLALVMTMSLVTVSAGAKDFTDADELNYEEAVAVMSDLKIVGGYTDGSFNPQGNLTRQAAAKIICNLILGPTTASALRADTAPFKDVAVTNDFAGYITYCAQQGIINGYADGSFRPTAPLTGYAFMKMLLGALGYDGSIEGYTGPNWSVAVAKRAIGIGLNAGLVDAFNGVKTVNREEACLYAFNTLKSTMVDYDSRTTVSVGGSEVVIAGSSAQDVANSGKETIYNDNKLQFAEKYFSKLVLNDETIDAFGRPANTWTYNKKEIGTFADYTLLVDSYTAAVKGSELYDLLGASAVNTNTMKVYADGVDVTDTYAKQVARNYKKTFATTGNGVLTEVYMDVDNDEITIVEINTYLAIVDGDYNEKKDTVSLSVQGIDEVATDVFVKTAAENENMVISGEDFAVAEEMKDGEKYLVTVAEGAIQSIATPEVMDEVEISSFKKADNYTIEGEVYSRAHAGVYDGLLTAWTDGTIVNMKDTTYNVYLDAYGYVIGIEVVEAEDNYVFITAYDTYNSGLASKNADAFAIFTDGTSENIKVKMKGAAEAWTGSEATENTWYTYTTDKNGVYTLGAIDRSYTTSKGVAQYWTNSDGLTIDKAHVSLEVNYAGGSANKYAYGNNDTVYLVAEVSKLNLTSGRSTAIISDVASMTTGVKNVSLTTMDNAAVLSDVGANDADTANGIATGGVYPLYSTSKGYIIACVVVGEDESVSDNLVYVTGNVARESYDKTEDEFTWTQDGILNGEEVTLTYKGDVLDELSDSLKGNWVIVSYKADGSVKRVNVLDTEWTTNSSKYIVGFNNFNGTLSGLDKTDVALVMNYLGSGNDLFMDGYTLHIDKTLGANTGIDVTGDCKAVVVEKWNDTEYRTEIYDSSANNVRAAINALQTNPLANGKVYAVMDGGLATTVIFVDETSQYDNEYRPGTGVGTGDAYDVALSYGSSKYSVTWKCDKALAAGTKLNVTIYTADGGLVGAAPEYTVGAGGIPAGNSMGLDVAKTVIGDGTGTYDVVINIGGTETVVRLAIV